MFDRGINFSEFVSIIMKEPPPSGAQGQGPGMGGAAGLQPAKDEAGVSSAAARTRKGSAAASQAGHATP